VAAASVASLLMLECGARLLLDPPRYHEGPVEFHPALGFRGVPGHRHEAFDDRGAFTFQLSSQGLRGPELPEQPTAAKPGVSRVVFVGDSFLVGQAIRAEHLVTSQTAAALKARGLEAEVYNLSAIDYGTGQEILLLGRLGRRLEPDAVVLFLYPSNDVINNSLELAGRTAVSAGDYIRPYLAPVGGELEIRYAHPFRALLRRHSRLFGTLERRVLAVGADRGIAWLQPWPARAGVGERVRAGRAPREEFEIFRHHDPGHRWETAWRTTFGLLRTLRDECDAMGARLLVAVVPSIHQVLRTAKGVSLDIATRTAGGRALDLMLDWNLPERRLARFFESEGIEARFLLAPLRAAAKEHPGVYTRDEHLGRRGHAIAAGPIVEWLVDRAAGQGVETISGRPVRARPDPSAAPLLLDFRAERHADHLGDGWISWAPEESEQAGGWLSGPSTLAVIPARGGDFVVRGWVPSAARLPIDGRVQIIGGSRHPFHLDQIGPFEIRFSWSPRGGLQEPTADGYVAALLVPGETHRAGGIRAGLVVQEIGFETAGDDDVNRRMDR
jgi:hypothetical protein